MSDPPERGISRGRVGRLATDLQIGAAAGVLGYDHTDSEAAIGDATEQYQPGPRSYDASE